MAEGPLPGTVRPSNEAVFKAAQALVSLVSQHLPQRFYQTERRWRSYGVAMVARMADILESLLVLMNAGRQMDGAALVRVLYEHVVKYCWIAIDPDEHLPRWSSDALYWERKLHDDLAEYGQGFLSREELERETYASAKQLPKMIELAEQVDQHWGGRLDAFIPAGKGPLGIFTLRGFYNAVYRTLSEPVHARPEALRGHDGWHIADRLEHNGWGRIALEFRQSDLATRRRHELPEWESDWLGHAEAEDHDPDQRGDDAARRPD